MLGDQESPLHLGDSEILAGAQRRDTGNEHPQGPLVVVLDERLVGPEARGAIGAQLVQGQARVGRVAETVQHSGPGFDDDRAVLVQQVIETGFVWHTYPYLLVCFPNGKTCVIIVRKLRDIKPVGRGRRPDLLLMAGCGVALRGSPRPCVPRDGGGTEGGDAKWQPACKTC